MTRSYINITQSHSVNITVNITDITDVQVVASIKLPTHQDDTT